MGDWFVEQMTPHAPGLWLLIGLLTNALLLSSEQLVARTWRGPLWIGLWLLVPYLGLLLGGLSPRLMGLSGIDWPVSLSLGLGIGFAVVLLLTLVRATLAIGDESLRSESSQMGHVARPVLAGILLWSGVTQFHWSFLRGGIWEALLTLPQPPALPGYWAVWSAAAIVVLQLLWVRPAFAVLLVHLATLLTTSILFFYTRNFWLCWALHAAVQMIAAPSLVQALEPGRHRVTRGSGTR